MILRWMLWRRGIDAPLLAFAIAMLALGNGIGKAILVVFALLGINLVFARHRVLRYLDPAFTLAVTAYFAWTAGLIFWRGEWSEGNRFLTYASIILAGGILAPSFALVRRPLAVLVSGARVGTIAAVVLSLIAMGGGEARIGIGFNVALFAFLVAAIGFISRIRIDGPPSFLPNGVFWSYLSLVPVVATGTRAAWLPYILMILFDLGRLALHWARSGRLRWPPLAAAAVLAVAGGVALLPMVETRVADFSREMENFERSGTAVGSTDVRIVMWSAAAEVVAEHPLVGVGPEERMEAVAERAEPQNRDYVASYSHLHNFLVDEVVSNGLPGLVLLLSLLGIFFWRVVASGERGGLIPASVFFLSLVVSFGSFHGVFLNERTLGMMFIVMALILAHLRRLALGGPFAPARGRPGAPPLR